MARVAALQALYEMDLTRHPLDAVMEARLAEAALADDSRQFAFHLVNGVLAHKTEIDILIRQYAPEFPLDQIALVDRNVLRIAIFEINWSGNAPLKVAIDEAIEIAKEYGSESSARFVNGVLGTLAATQNKTESPSE